ncbi:MAG: AAA family ATPase [Acidimicrobiia bacterium]|nr:AAA family ATPase [Acidimicrobiia bacterium]
MTDQTNPQAAAGVAETHAGIVFFVGDRAYKVKKGVKFAFLDFSTRDRRRLALERELTLNRRLAPDVYLGILDVVGADGTPLDHVLEMRRMPDTARLTSLVRAGRDLTGEIDEIADRMAEFHAGAPTGGEIDTVGLPETILGHWRDNVAEMRPHVEGGMQAILDPDEFERCWILAREYVSGRHPLFAARVEAGCIRDGHGDLLCDDIFCLDDGVRILDCIEFDDRLRWGDVVADIGFLAMDLERIGAVGLAERLLDRYRDMTCDTAPRSLVHHYIAYRAHVRTKVAVLRHAQGDDAALQKARLLLDICLSHLEEGRPRIVLVGGSPGTGKTTVAEGLGRSRGWAVLRSDLVRKELCGVEPTDHTQAGGFGTGLYSTETTTRTYAELARRAGTLVGLGESVVLDATWSSAEGRESIRRLGAETGAEVVELRCVCDPAEAARRVEARLRTGRDASDATADVAARMTSEFEPWPEAHVVDTTGDVDTSIATALRAVTPRAGRA